MPLAKASKRRTAQLDLLVFAVPGFLAYALFVIVPMVATLVSSLTNRNLFFPTTSWIGFGNYTKLFTDPSFYSALSNTVFITVVVTVAANGIGLAIALLLAKQTLFYRALRSVFFAPVVLSSVVVAVTWRALLQDDGILNDLLTDLGVANPPRWLSDPDLAMGSLTAIVVWQVLGLCVVVYLAGLASVPAELPEAATLDGAGALAMFRHITWPLLASAVTINVVMVLITAFKVYDQVRVITNGGPGNGTTATIAFNTIQTSFDQGRVGYGASMAIVMLIIIAAVSAAALRLLRRREVQL